MPDVLRVVVRRTMGRPAFLSVLRADRVGGHDMSAMDLLVVAAVSVGGGILLAVIELWCEFRDSQRRNKRGDRLRRWLKFHGGVK